MSDSELCLLVGFDLVANVTWLLYIEIKMHFVYFDLQESTLKRFWRLFSSFSF